MAGLEAKVIVEHRSAGVGLLGGIRSGIFGESAGPAGGGMMAGVGKMAGSLGVLAGVGSILASTAGQILQILSQASGLLGGVLKGIHKTIMLLLKPLGDILGVALMPILYILKPIGTFFNAIMKPYIQKAMDAMKAGGALMKAGDPVGALAAFTVGAEYLMKPFVDAAITANGQMMGWFADLLSKIPVVGVAFQGMGDTIRKSGQLIVDVTTNVLDVQLGAVLGYAEAKTGKAFSGIVKSIGDAEVTLTYLSMALSNNIAAPFTSVNDWVKDTWGPAFKKNVQDIFEEARNKGYSAGKSEAQRNYSPYIYGAPVSIPSQNTAPTIKVQLEQIYGGGGMSTSSIPGQGKIVGTRTDIGQAAVEAYLDKYFSGMG